MKSLIAAASAVILLAGCATTPDATAPSLATSASPAWSLDSGQREMIVAVSPARQTLQLAGATGTILGAGISAISNAKHRGAIEEILHGYDAGKTFEEALATRLEAALGDKLARAEAMGSWTGYKNQREAEVERFRAIAKGGHDVLLDLDMTYGLFGFEGTLIAKIDGELRSLPEGRLLWENALVVSSEDILASDRLTDPTKRMAPNVRSPRLTVEEGAIEQWTSDGGALLKTRMNESIEGAVSALLTDLGLADEASGHYYLGRLAMNRKEFESAHAHFQKALQLDPAMVAAKNGLSVNLAHNGQLDEAVQVAREIAAAQPDYGPAFYNLAWWLALESNDPAAAAEFYSRAQALGMPQEKKIEEALKKKS